MAVRAGKLARSLVMTMLSPSTSVTKGSVNVPTEFRAVDTVLDTVDEKTGAEFEKTTVKE